MRKLVILSLLLLAALPASARDWNRRERHRCEAPRAHIVVRPDFGCRPRGHLRFHLERRHECSGPEHRQCRRPRRW